MICLVLKFAFIHKPRPYEFQCKYSSSYVAHAPLATPSCCFNAPTFCFDAPPCPPACCFVAPDMTSLCMALSVSKHNRRFLPRSSGPDDAPRLSVFANSRVSGVLETFLKSAACDAWDISKPGRGSGGCGVSGRIWENCVGWIARHWRADRIGGRAGVQARKCRLLRRGRFARKKKEIGSQKEGGTSLFASQFLKDSPSLKLDYNVNVILLQSIHNLLELLLALKRHHFRQNILSSQL